MTSRVLLTCLLLVAGGAPDLRAQPVTTADEPWTGTTEQKVWGLMKVWASAKYTFPHFAARPDLDWDGAVQACLPRVIAAPDQRAYYDVLAELVASLKDGHTYVLPPWGRFEPGHDLAPIEVRILDGRFYVDRVAAAPELAAQGLRPGVEILTVDGIPVGRHFAENVLRFHAGNTRHGDEAQLVVYLLAGPAGERMTLAIRQQDGTVREASVVRNAMSGGEPFLTRMLANVLAGPTIRTRELPGGIRYVEIPNFDHEQAATDFAALVDSLDTSATAGMILDVRYNLGGSSQVVASIVGCLVGQPVPTPTMRFRHYVGAHEAWGQDPVWETASSRIEPRDGRRYLGPLVVLTSGLTGSSAEDLAIELRSAGRARLVGGRTAGSAGNGLQTGLPGGGSFTVSTFTALVPGGDEYVGSGIAPDLEIEPTPADLAAGRDAVLERAVELLSR